MAFDNLIKFGEHVSQDTIDLVRDEVAGWPEALRDDFLKHGITIEVGRTLSEVPSIDTLDAPDESAYGYYYAEPRKLLIKEMQLGEDGEISSLDPEAIIMTLNHEAGHAVAMTLLDNLPEKTVFKRLHNLDLTDIYKANEEVYNTLEPSFRKATNTHHYKDSPFHEAFAEAFGSALSSDKGDARLSWETSPRVHALCEHILANYEHGELPLKDLDDFDVIFVSTGRRVAPRINPQTGKPSRFQPEERELVTGHKLEEINRVMKSPDLSNDEKIQHVQAIFERRYGADITDENMVELSVSEASGDDMTYSA